MSTNSQQTYPQQAAVEQAQAVKKAYQRMLMAKANVVGVGVGFAQHAKQMTNQVALIVLVSRKLPVELLLPEDIIPSELEGVPVDVQEVGTIKAV